MSRALQQKERPITALTMEELEEDEIAYLAFSQQREMACSKDGWLQGRYYSSDGVPVADMLSFNAVFEICPFEIGVNRTTEKHVFAARRKKLVEVLQLGELMARPFASLSNGEMRRVLFAKALLKNPKKIVLEHPMAGLDGKHRKLFRTIISSLRKNGVAVQMAGDCESGTDETNAVDMRWTTKRGSKKFKAQGARPIVEIKDLSIRFGKKWIFRNFNWQVRKGERWVLRGPNGCGKTTLLALITGDSPLAYANDVKVFGQPREPGHELSRIRRRIGMIGAEMQTYLGEEPMAMLGRAFARNPDLLLLDEPCMNLDSASAAKLCRRVSAWLKAHPMATAICVAHRPEHVPAGFDHELNLNSKPTV